MGVSRRSQERRVPLHREYNPILSIAIVQSARSALALRMPKVACTIHADVWCEDERVTKGHYRVLLFAPHPVTTAYPENHAYSDQDLTPPLNLCKTRHRRPVLGKWSVVTNNCGKLNPNALIRRNAIGFVSHLRGPLTCDMG
ncbi:hypothetical protein N7G274_003160 [Stereocaulon virgatum]|uniref:Uncharacterized protein n=1 Tax=Stereocaulon virgatum TaxID=373712 RepID=A0ABR4AG85_9LECA